MLSNPVLSGGYMKKILMAAFAAFLLFSMFSARAEDEKFEITAFDVRGNSLLAKGDVDTLVKPFTGKDRVYGDVQRALEALEAAYRAKGYGTVTVYVPEQELKGGVVVLQVTEAVLGKIAVSGNQFFDNDNVRASLPLLLQGSAPNLSAISDNVQLANENPARQLDVILKGTDQEGLVDIDVNVNESNVEKVTLSFDNSGNGSTGVNRVGIAYQHANLFDRDHVGTFNYQTSPQ